MYTKVYGRIKNYTAPPVIAQCPCRPWAPTMALGFRSGKSMLFPVSPMYYGSTCAKTRRPSCRLTVPSQCPVGLFASVLFRGYLFAAMLFPPKQAAVGSGRCYAPTATNLTSRPLPKALAILSSVSMVTF